MSILKTTSFQILSATMAGERQERIFRTAHRADFDHVDRRPGYLYVRSRAISSRINENYDGFDADEIKKGYQTFMGKPVFVSHHNQNHRRARGAIVAVGLHEDFLASGEPDTWVEVLMEVDAINFPRLAKAIIAGEVARTSMGCDVVYSRCTFCANKAYTEAEYCSHIPRLKGKRIRRVNAKTGESEEVLVAEQCFGLNFFENSLLVEDPADPSAAVLSPIEDYSNMPPRSASTNSSDSHVAYAEAVANGSQRQLSTMSFAGSNERKQLSLNDEHFFFGQSVSRSAYAPGRAPLGNHIGGVVGVGAEPPMGGIVTEGHVAGMTDDESFGYGSDQLGVSPAVRAYGASFGVGPIEASIPSTLKDPSSPQPAFVRTPDGNLRPVPFKFGHGGLETIKAVSGQGVSDELNFTTDASRSQYQSWHTCDDCGHTFTHQTSLESHQDASGHRGHHKHYPFEPVTGAHKCWMCSGKGERHGGSCAYCGGTGDLDLADAEFGPAQSDWTPEDDDEPELKGKELYSSLFPPGFILTAADNERPPIRSVGPVIHGQECYEAWRNGQDCPHEHTASKLATGETPLIPNAEQYVRDVIDRLKHAAETGPDYNRNVAQAVSDARLFLGRGEIGAALRFAYMAQMRAGELTWEEYEVRTKGPQQQTMGRKSFGRKRVATLHKHADSDDYRLQELPCTSCGKSTWIAPHQFAACDHCGKSNFGGYGKTAINETIAPPEVDTLRDSECPICFTAETLIRIEDGYVPIASVEVGDRVLASDGEFHPVLEVMENDYDGLLYAVKSGTMIRPVLVTPDHPFRTLVGHHPFRETCEPEVCIRYGEDYVGTRGYGEEQSITHHLDWVPVRELTTQSFIATNVPREVITRIESVKVPDQYLGKTAQGRSQRKGPKEFALTEDFLWILGLYIAEGSNSKRHITFTLHEKEIEYADRVLAFAREHGYTANVLPGNGAAINVEVYSSVLAEWFPAWLGHGSHNKAIPQEFISLPNQMKSLIAGIMAGDGYTNHDRIKQTSPVLALQLAEISIQNEMVPGISFQGGAARQRKDSYSVLGVQEQRKRTTFWSIDGHMLTRVREIRQLPYAGKVYNLRVEGDPSYTVQNILVHNCGSDAYNGEECPVCMFIKPPDMFMDPDLEAAQNADLRQDVEDASNAGSDDVMQDQGSTPVQDDMANAGQNMDKDNDGPESGIPQTDQTMQPATAPVTAPVPAPQAPGQQAGGEPPPPANDESMPIAPGQPNDDQPPPAGKELPKPKKSDDTDDKDGDKPPWDKDPNKQKPKPGDDADKKDDGPPWAKSKNSRKGVKPSIALREGDSQMSVATTTRVLAQQQAAIRQLRAENAQLKRSVNYIARLAGIVTADEHDPAQPVPQPAGGAPSQTSDDARRPAAQVDVQQIGATPVAGVAADATTTVDSIGGIEADHPYSINTEVTTPVSGTETRIPLDQVRTLPEIQFGNPLSPTQAFPLGGEWAEKASLGSKGRTYAALRLAKLRRVAGIDSSGLDELVLANQIDTNASLTDAALAAEIETLSAVVSARREPRVPRQAARRLVPQSTAGVERTIPSVAVGDGLPQFTSAATSDEDAFAFCE
jgi:Hint domain